VETTSFVRSDMSDASAMSDRGRLIESMAQ